MTKSTDPQDPVSTPNPQPAENPAGKSGEPGVTSAEPAGPPAGVVGAGRDERWKPSPAPRADTLPSAAGSTGPAAEGPAGPGPIANGAVGSSAGVGGSAAAAAASTALGAGQGEPALNGAARPASTQPASSQPAPGQPSSTQTAPGQPRPPTPAPAAEPRGAAEADTARRPSLADAVTVQVPVPTGPPGARSGDTGGGGSNGTLPAAPGTPGTAPGGSGESAQPLPPPWQRVPAAATSGDRTPASSPGREPSVKSGPGGRANSPASPTSAGAAAAGVGVGAAATPDRAAGPPQGGGLSNARTVTMDPPTTEFRMPPGGVDEDASPPAESPRPSSAPGGFPMSWPRNRRPRQAALQLKRLDPWSVLKIALVLAVVLYLVWLVAVGVLYGVLDGIGVWDRLNGQYADLVAEQSGERLISAGRVFGVAAVIGAVNSLLVAVAMSVGAFVYNVAADLVGGVEVTLSERD